MSGDVDLHRGRSVAIPPAPDVLALKVHGSESAERAAIRSKDRHAIEVAVRAKLEAQRDFAADYRIRFQDSAHRPNNSARSGRVSAEEHCQHFGFADRTVRRWAERLLDDARFEIEAVERIAKVCQIVEMEQAANFSSESFEWYTPARYIELVRAVLGEIDLDPASSEQANEVVEAAEFFNTGGLMRDWHGRVFLNPPYGKTEDGSSLAAAFCNKAIAEYRSGRVSACIILVNSLHSQSWQRPLYAFVVCLVDHRIQFISSDGEENKSPTFQNAFFYLGTDVEKFAHQFSTIGYVVQRLTT